MSNNVRKIICTWYLVLCTFVPCMALQTTEGTEFWVTFLNNFSQPVGSTEMTLKLIASSRQDASLTITNPQTGWSVSSAVSAHQMTEITIPHEQGYTYQDGVVEQRGLKVTSSAPISLYASNYVAHTYDATIVLPVEALSNDYIIQIYENNLMSKEFGVVATADGTNLTITPHARTRDNKVKNVPFTVTLNAGETYQVMSADASNDFSGSRIVSDKPVAVFSGHVCINVPTGNPWCDHIVEQQTPVVLWGRQFAVTQTAGQAGDRVMITAAEDQTQVRVNGALVATLNTGESYEWRLTDRSAWVETSQAAACYLYLEGARDNEMTGDPSMVHITPVEQRTKELTFATFQTDESRTHYANVVTTVAGAAAMRMDGQSVAEFFAPLDGNASLRFAQIPVEHGTHTLATTSDGFIGHIYGVGYCESYAYNMGQAVTPLTGLVVVNGQSRSEVDYNDEYCYLQPVAFRPNTNIEYTAVHWDFGDGNESDTPEPTHRYTSPGDYLVTMYVTGQDNQDTARTTLHLTDVLHESLNVVLCEGERYTMNGIEYTETGTYSQTLRSVGGCDSIVSIHVQVNDTSIRYDTIQAYAGTSVSWHGRWYREAGDYRDTLQSQAGCDSIVQLTLIVVEPVQEMYDTICWQPTYHFMDYDYPIPPMDGLDPTEYYNYTVEYRDVVECLTYKMHLAIIHAADGEQIILHDTIQQGQTYTFFGETLRKEGTYTHSLSLACECTRTYILYLTVLSYPIIEESAVLCHEDTILFRGHEYTEPGVYNDTAFSLTGIDAVYRLNLSDSRSYKEISLIITAGTVLPPPLGQITQSGTYRFTFTNAAGCDSIVTWYIGVNERCIVPIEEHYTLCAGDAYEWHGQSLTEAKVYTDTLWHRFEEDCDTAVVLYLDLLPVARRDTSIAICPGDYCEIGAEKLSEPGDYPISLRAANGCDSILTVHLSYLPDYHDTTRVTIPYGDSFRWEREEWSDSTEQVRGFIAANGCDSIEVLQLGIDYSLTVEQLEWEGGCGDGDFFTLHVQLSRLVDSVRVTFTKEAKAAGLRDSTVYIHAKQADILIPHAGVRAGSYTCTVALVHGEGTLYAASIAFTLLYPSSVLEQAWNDVVAVLTHDYNGGYDFAAFQWYENGVALSGENHSYLYRPLIIGGEYSALLTESNGTQMMTCPLIVTYQTDISLYPTIVSARQAIQCHVSEEAEIWVYDALGRLIIHGALPVGDTSVPAPGAIGVYIARVVTKANKKEHTYKLIVR